MRVLRREEFLKLPAGTVYAKGKEHYFDGLEFKGDTCDSGGVGDWWSHDPCWVDAESSEEAFERMEEMLDVDSSYPMETAEGRDGLYEEGALFLVFEYDDLVKLKALVERGIDVRMKWTRAASSKEGSDGGEKGS